MVSYGYEQAVRKLAPCDSPFEWGRDDRHPDVDPQEADDGE